MHSRAAAPRIVSFLFLRAAFFFPGDIDGSDRIGLPRVPCAGD